MLVFGLSGFIFLESYLEFDASRKADMKISEPLK